MDGEMYDYYYSELREDVNDVVTEVSELSAVHSEQSEVIQTQISELAEAQSEHVSEMVSVIGDTSLYVTALNRNVEIEVILLFVIIAFCGFISGLLIINLTRK